MHADIVDVGEQLIDQIWLLQPRLGVHQFLSGNLSDGGERDVLGSEGSSVSDTKTVVRSSGMHIGAPGQPRRTSF